MHLLRIIARFMQVSLQEEAAYRVNFFISLFYSLLNLGTGILGVVVVFEQVESIRGWTQDATLALLGVYLTVSALRGLFIGPGLEALAGMDGEIWSGNFDFTVLRPVNTQLLVSLRKWRWFSLVDLLLGLSVLGASAWKLQYSLSAQQTVVFLLALLAGTLTLYAILLAFAALVFWSPEVLFTWIFNGLFQMARYPVGIYPGWLRLALTWVIPVGLITTFPAQALTGALQLPALAGSLAMSLALVTGASLLFRNGLKRYASASS
jgi:ABC-2 type transport system permease protein